MGITTVPVADDNLSVLAIQIRQITVLYFDVCTACNSKVRHISFSIWNEY